MKMLEIQTVLDIIIQQLMLNLFSNFFIFTFEFVQKKRKITFREEVNCNIVNSYT
ncbi:MAG: hypothetical protein KAX49_03240 [Halanaerobiales bacterium]|nr:hypothetical protein [Halanaerobiales bacterium]